MYGNGSRRCLWRGGIGGDKWRDAEGGGDGVGAGDGGQSKEEADKSSG